MSVEIITAALSFVIGILGILIGVKNLISSKRKKKIRLKIDDKIIDISEVEKELILKVLKSSRVKKRPHTIGKTSSKKLSQEGYAGVEALLLIVPGIIALLFAITFVYLLIHNQENPTYSTPKELGAAMTTIIGYYFGVGASSAINKSKTISAEALNRELSQSD